MEKHLRHSSSRVPYENNHPGCMWGILHFFDFHHHLHIRKVLLDRRHGSGRRAGGIKVPKMKQNAHLIGEEHDLLDREAKFAMEEDKVKTTNESSGKASMRSLISKGVSRGQDQKRRISPLASRLLRTISIHHLECNDYVRPDEMTSDSETSGVDLHSHDTDSSASSENVPLLPNAPDGAAYGERCEVCGTLNALDYVGHKQLDELGNHLLGKQALLKEKLNEAKEALSKQKSVDAKEMERDAPFDQSKAFLDMLELFHANRELFLKILQDPNSALENYLQGLQASSAEVALTKSGSFPGAGLFGRKSAELHKLKHKHKEKESFVKQEGKSQAGNPPPIPKTINSEEDDSQAVASMAGGEVGTLKQDAGSMESAGTSTSVDFSPGSPHELKSTSDDGTIRNRFKNMKQKLKELIKERKRELHRISLDGALHKIPYGHKVSEDVNKEKSWEEPASNRNDGDSPGRRFGSDGTVSAHRKYANKSIRRSQSLTESLDRYSHLLDFNVSRESKRPSERLKLVHEDGCLPAKKSPKTLGRIFSLPEFESYYSSRDVQSELSHASYSTRTPSTDPMVSNAAVDTYGSIESKPVATNVHEEDSTPADNFVDSGHQAQSVEIDAIGMINGGLEQPMLINEHNESLACDVPDDLGVEDSSSAPLYEDIGIAVDPSDKPAKPSPISVLDSYLHEDPVSPAKYSVPEGSELKLRSIHFDELDPLANAQKQLDVDVSNVAETAAADFDKVQVPREHSDFDDIDIQVDQKDEAEFSYVRDILRKSGISSNEFLGAWYLPNQPVDPSLFGEAEGSPHELEIAGDGSDTFLDHQLLFDLTNEVLSEIYESYFARCPWLSGFDSCTRPVPVGYHLLEEVWANISWHLSIQPQLNPTVDYVVARDFAKSDGWMNLQCDTESVALELEDMILDDLLDDVTLQVGDLSSSRYIPS